jgi:RNA polymerase primary sigma factor
MFTKKNTIKAANLVELKKKEQERLLEYIYQGEGVVDIGDRKKRRAIMARKLLKEKCKPLIIAVIRKYKESGLSFEELLTLGEAGLMRAISAWNRDHGKRRKYRFSVYATWFIRAEIHKKLGLPTNPEGL